jgi:hypothetical protein
MNSGEVLRNGYDAGAAPADAVRRVDVAITAAATAVHKARRSAVILGFSTAASLLFGAAVAWYAACEGGRHRDDVAPSLDGDGQRGHLAIPPDQAEFIGVRERFEALNWKLKRSPRRLLPCSSLQSLVI